MKRQVGFSHFGVEYRLCFICRRFGKLGSMCRRARLLWVCHNKERCAYNKEGAK